MTLLRDEFEDRYSEVQRVRWSNPDKQGTEVDQPRIDRAVADTEAWFQTEIEAAYDGTDVRHVMIGHQVVRAFLLSYGASNAKSAERAFERLEKQAGRLRGTTSRKHALPQSTSALTVDQDKAGDKPMFDAPRFDPHIPDNDSSRTNLDSD